MGSFSYVLHSFTMVFYLILQMKYVCASLKRKVLTVPKLHRESAYYKDTYYLCLQRFKAL